MRGSVVAFLFAGALFVSIGLSSAEAATVGSWSKECTAPNWITGAPQPVAEMSINDPSKSFWGFTSRQPGGGWLTQYNLARISAPPDVLIFLFYHECSHAVFNTTSEAVADCEGLKAMGQDVNVTPQVIDDIRKAYASVGRPFPSGPCSNPDHSDLDGHPAQVVKSEDLCAGLRKAIALQESSFSSIKGPRKRKDLWDASFAIGQFAKCEILDVADDGDLLLVCSGSSDSFEDAETSIKSCLENWHEHANNSGDSRAIFTSVDSEAKVMLMTNSKDDLEIWVSKDLAFSG